MDTPRALVPLPTTGLHQRAADVDRAAVCDQLSTHYAAGRLHADELEARLGAAVAAETLLDLRRLVSDLPLAPAPVTHAPAPTRPSASWRPLDVLAVLLVVGCLGLAGLGLLLLVTTSASLLVVAVLLGGAAAAAGGAALAHLAYRGVQHARQPRP